MRRQRNVTTYFTEEEYEQLKKLADAAGITVASAVRMCVLYVMREVLIHTSFVHLVARTKESERETHMEGGE